jgi:2-methylcitrate dehydratase PrpD
LFRDGMFLAEPAERKRAPETMVDAQFSLQYAAAAVLARGRASLPEFLDDCIRDSGIRTLAQRITVEHRAAFDAMFPQHYPSDVALTTRSGEVFREARDNPVGDTTRPLDDNQLRTKFEMLAQFAVTPEQAQSIATAIGAVFGAGSPASLAAALRTPHRAGGA